MRRMIFLYVFGQDELTQLMFEMLQHRRHVYARHAEHKELEAQIAELQRAHAVSNSALVDAKEQHNTNRIALEKAYTLDLD